MFNVVRLVFFWDDVFCPGAKSAQKNTKKSKQKTKKTKRERDRAEKKSNVSDAVFLGTCAGAPGHQGRRKKGKKNKETGQWKSRPRIKSNVVGEVFSWACAGGRGFIDHPPRPPAGGPVDKPTRRPEDPR